MKDRLQKAHHLTAEKAGKRATANRETHDAKISESALQPVDIVVVRNKGFRETGS